MIDLNEMAVQSAEIAEKRGQGTDVMKTLKHCAGEVIEAAEAYAKASLDSFASELADVVMCILTICGSNGVQIETALKDCIGKNRARIEPETEKTAPQHDRKLYTTLDIAKMLGIKRASMNQYLYTFKQQNELVSVRREGKNKLYSQETVDKIVRFFQKGRNTSQKGKRKKSTANTGEDKPEKQPEAVKPEQKPAKRFERDPRCDDPNWWPDPTPQCFRNEEENEWL